MRAIRDIRVVWARPEERPGEAARWAEELGSWSRDGAALHAHGDGRVLKKEASADAERIDGVYRATLAGREVVMKCRTLRRWGDRVKAAVRMGRADRHRRGAAWLERHGIETAAVLVQAQGRVEEHAGGGRGTTYPAELLVMEFIEGPTLLEIMAAVVEERPDAPSVREQHELARAVGRQVFAFAIARGYNRDHKPSNLIVRREAEDDGGWGVAVIDAVAIRPGSDTRIPSMLASLVIEPTGCGCAPRRALMMRVLVSIVESFEKQFSREYRRLLLRQTWRRAQAVVTRHGDPRPRINPLDGRSSTAC